MTSLDVSRNDTRSNTKIVARSHSAPNERAKSSARPQRSRLLGRVTLALPVLGAAAGAWLLSKGAARRSAGLGALGAALGLGLARWQLQRFVTERVPYEVVATLGNIELRNYPAQVWAETDVQRVSWKEALNEGFRRLAGYIFGDNRGGERFSMTAPVLSSLPALDEPAEGRKLPMSAPVLATLDASNDVKDRTVSFVMPADLDLADLPAPNDTRVRLRQVPERLLAVLTFRGNYAGNLPALKRDELLRRLGEAGMKTRGEVRFAGYDPPSTLPALRRNEVLVELADG